MGRRGVSWGAVWALGALLAFSASGLAAALSGGSDTLGAGSSPVPRCDGDGITVVHTLSSGNVVGVTIGGVAPACGGASLSVTVDNGSARSTAIGAVPLVGGTVTLTLGTPVALVDALRTDVAVSGP